MGKKKTKSAKKREKKKRKEEEEKEQENINENVENSEIKNEDEKDVKEKKEEKIISYPLKVIYCEFCDYPLEFCEISPFYEKKCKENLKVNYPNVLKRIELLKEQDKKKNLKSKSIKKKKLKVEEGDILITITKRGKRKNITNIYGLDLNGIILKDFAKAFAKKYSVGCGEKSEVPEKCLPKSVEIRGNSRKDCFDFIINKFKIDPNLIYTTENKKKVLFKDANIL